MGEDRNFLSRWSDRKAEARRGTLTDEEERHAALAPQPDVATAAEGGPQAAAADAEGDGGGDAELAIPEELKGIDIDSLGYDADFTVFLKPGVPEALRKKALRRLWRTDPVLACLDGLNDYEEDFTDAAMAVKGLESAYRIGKGYFFADQETGGEEALAGAEDEAPEVETPETAGAEGAGDAGAPEGAEAETVADADAAADAADPVDVTDPVDAVEDAGTEHAEADAPETTART